MTWLIIGSTAGYHWFGSKWRKPTDLDLLTKAKISGNYSKECVVDASWHDVAQSIIDQSEDKVFADPRILYTLKLSHAHWNIHWNKTMIDLNKFKELGFNEAHEQLYDDLVAVWETIHGKKHVNLNQPVETFFNDAVTRVYSHELLHELVAMTGPEKRQPMHVHLRPDQSSVWCSVELFKALDPEDQILAVHEELLVTAIERYKLTKLSSQFEIRHAVNGAYKTLCTSMTKGWFARFMLENHVDILYTRRPKWQKMLLATLSSLPTPKTS